MALTPQKENFVFEYLKDRNGRKAAERAGYTKNSARVRASQLLKEDEVRRFMADVESKIKNINDNKEIEAVKKKHKSEKKKNTRARISKTAEECDHSEDIIDIEESLQILSDIARGKKPNTKISDIIAATRELLKYLSVENKDKEQEGGIVILSKADKGD